MRVDDQDMPDSNTTYDFIELESVKREVYVVSPNGEKWAVQNRCWKKLNKHASDMQ